MRANATGPSDTAILLKGYPRLSETFIAQEILALERRGLHAVLYSMRRPTDPAVHPIHGEIAAPVHYLPEYLHAAPLRVIRAWWQVRRWPAYGAAVRDFLADLRREPTRNRLRRFGQALVLAAELPAGIRRLHAHFLHTPASVARYAARLRALPFSISAHAKDVWTIPEWEKREKLADCAWLVTCTRTNAEHLAALSPVGGRVHLAYHGFDPRRFPPFGATRPDTDGSDPERPVIILSVGRAVAKKGYDRLLAALARLPADLHWHFLHIGQGTEMTRLQREAQRLRLSPRITWRGAQPQAEVLHAYRAADLFVLAARIADDGDRDGLPNVLMEAQSQGLACLATGVSAIPELITDGETGVLVATDDVAALADRLEFLIRHPAARHRLGAAAMRHVHTHFTLDRHIDPLAARFGLSAERVA